MPTNPIKEIERLLKAEFSVERANSTVIPAQAIYSPDSEKICAFIRTQFISVLKSLGEEIKKLKQDGSPFSKSFVEKQNAYNAALDDVASIISKYIDSK